MGIFSRRRALAAGWQSDSAGVVTCPAELTNDPLAAGELAYGARFWLAGTGASLTIWAYAQYCGTGEGYIVAFRVDRLSEDTPEGDAASISYADPAWAEWFSSAGTAESNAMQAAALLVAGDRGAALSLYAGPDVISEWFGWDGNPLP
jgi:hypothetical protein